MTILLLFLIAFVHSKRLPNIYWNSTNRIFDISNTDHVVPVEINDRISIYCPKPSNESDYEFSIIYMVKYPTVSLPKTNSTSFVHLTDWNFNSGMISLCPNMRSVSEEEYTHCFLKNPHIIGSCNNNTQEVSISLTFRQFTPTPGGLEFVPGETYHIITTSEGNLQGIDRRKGGLCSEKQMKIKFEVKGKDGKWPNPKFAARTLTRERGAETTPIMYIIHTDETEEEDDDDSGASFGLLSSLTVVFTVYLLHL